MSALAAEAALLDPALIDAFRRDGYVHVKGLVDPAEIADLGAEVDRAVALRTRLDDRTLAEKTPFEQSFTMCQSVWEDFPRIGELTFHPRIAGAAAALIGAPRVRLWHDQALYKQAHGRETEMHQDHPYWPITERDTLTAWIPLCEITHDMGTMGYIPGSHLGDETFIDVFTTPGQGHAFEATQSRKPTFVECGPGDVIFHHGSTIHLARPNLTDRTRRVHTAIYFADGCTRAAGRSHYVIEREGIAVGAPINGAATPIAWPLPGGRLPTPIPFPPMRDHPKLGPIGKRGVFPTSAG
jgi:ectoine hydroxylase-related dioxygenase (phytanoyl-CoA dioxygenase family)